MTRSRRRKRDQRSDSGLTLIELLAAIGILAVLSVMSVQALGGVMFQRTILTRLDDEGADLVRALTILRRDLEAVAPLIRQDEAFATVPVLSASSREVVFARSGIRPLLGQVGGGFGFVTWTLTDDGRLTRRSIRDPLLDPTESPAVTLLSDVQSMALSPVGGAMPNSDLPTGLPPGFELVLETRQFGRLRIVVTR